MRKKLALAIVTLLAVVSAFAFAPKIVHANDCPNGGTENVYANTNSIAYGSGHLKAILQVSSCINGSSGRFRLELLLETDNGDLFAADATTWENETEICTHVSWRQYGPPLNPGTATDFSDNVTTWGYFTPGCNPGLWDSDPGSTSYTTVSPPTRFNLPYVYVQNAG